MAKIGIIGAGAWGTALGAALSRCNHSVCLWALEKDVCESINNEHINKRFLPKFKLPENIVATNDMDFAAKDKNLIILASPSIYLLSTVRQLLRTPSFSNTEPSEQFAIGILTKGFIPDENGYPRFITDTLESILPEPYKNRLVYIAGPSHGEEVAMGKLTGLIAASKNPMAAIRCREILKSRQLLVYSGLDVIGVQTSAAAKNIIAIAFGLLDALTETSDIFGDNTESLLLAAGLNEIQTLGRALGATHPETFTSISGVGDLDVTCRSKFGRNRRFGMEIIKEDILSRFTGIDDIIANIAKIGYLPEGVVACKHVQKICEKLNLKLSITMGLYKILNKEVEPTEFIDKILHGENI
ncbi:MAG: glycerol-3-phosphate dehydrogenase [Treponema sp.]|nr:MAG: glycerol-3-phosphate dehydrogenase [Treponema sp.]